MQGDDHSSHIRLQNLRAVLQVLEQLDVRGSWSWLLPRRAHMPVMVIVAHILVVTQRRSVANSVGCFQRRLFVCLFVRSSTR